MPPNRSKNLSSNSEAQDRSFFARIILPLKPLWAAGKWALISVLLITSMRAAATRFLPAEAADQASTVSKVKKWLSATVTSGSAWWNPATPSSDWQGNANASGENAGKTKADVHDPSAVLPPLTVGSKEGTGSNPSSGDAGSRNALLGSKAPGAASFFVNQKWVPSGAAGGPRGLPQHATKGKGSVGKTTTTPGQNGSAAATGGSISVIGTPTSLVQSALSGSITKTGLVEGGLLLPVDHSYVLSSSQLFASNTQGASTQGLSEPAYAILGLSLSSTPSSATSPVLNDAGTADLHFSLSGTLASTPTYSVAETTVVGGLSAVPEPGTSGLLLVGVAAWSFRRRRVGPGRV